MASLSARCSHKPASLQLHRRRSPPAPILSASTNGNGSVAKTPASTKPFKNVNRFEVEPTAVAAFEEEWQRRAAAMQRSLGFAGLDVERSGSSYKVESRWKSIPDFEAWSLSEAARRSHLPLGVWQHVPKKGEGFPEDFVAFVEYVGPVTAQYP